MRVPATAVRRGAAVWPVLLGFALISCSERAPNAPGVGAARSASDAPAAAQGPSASNAAAAPSAITPADNGSTTPERAGAQPPVNGHETAAAGVQQGASDNDRGAAGDEPGGAGSQPQSADAGQVASTAGHTANSADDAARLAVADTASTPSAVPKVVEAVLEPTEGNHVRGTVKFTARDNVLVIDAAVSGLTPGKHGIHVHENGDCSAPDASSAGGHFNPDGHLHGGPASAIHHAGDLGNLDAMNDGKAKKEVITSDLSLSGRYGVIGRAVVVHADADDYHTNPGGNSGARVACGVIHEMTAAEAKQEAQTGRG